MVAINKGFFIRQLEKTAPNLDVLTDTIFEIGVQQIVVKVLDHTNTFPNPDLVNADLFADWLTFLQSKNVAVWGWADIYAGSPASQVQALLQRFNDTGLKQIVLRPMNTWAIKDAKLFVTMLSQKLPADTILAIANPPYQSDFPLVEFATVCKILMPIIPLDTLSGNLSANLTAIQTSYAQYFRDKQLMPVALTIGQTQRANFYWRARPDQIDEFLNICTELKIASVNFLAWQDVRYQQKLWSAIQSWNYQPRTQIAAPTVTLPIPTTSTSTSTPQITSNLTTEEQLHQYGVALGSDKGGTWEASEIENVLTVVQAIGESLIPLYEALYSSADAITAFRILFAPLLVKRNPTNNVNPNPDRGVWYGRNQAGFVMYYSNKMFITGRESLRTGDGLGFNSPQIIAHEFAHTINFRYPKISTLQGGDLDQFYGNSLQTGSYTLSTGESVRLSTVNDGYSFAARSSRDFYETVTDAIANYTYQGLTIGDNYDASQNLKGLARLEQLSSLLTHVLRHRVTNYGNLDAITSKIQSQFGDSVMSELSPALDALSNSDFNTRLSQYAS